MHLTNYAINKDNPDYEDNRFLEAEQRETGHKRKLKSVLELLEKDGCDTGALMEKIKSLTIKTLCSV